MRPMVLRFFLYIWGAILGTVLLVVGLTVSLGLQPPGHVPVEAVEGLMQAAAREAWAEGGREGVARLLARDGSFSEGFALVDATGAACAGPGRIGLADGVDPADGVGRADGGGCLVLTARPPLLAGVARFLPFLVPMTIGAAISLVLAFILTRRFVRPMQRIGEGLAALSQGRFDQRIGPALDRSEPAIADVGRAFDLAAGKLEDLTESRSRLFHDISHEIRSPLARLQAEAALLRQNPARLPAMLPRIEGDIARMDHLVGEILTLARLERGGGTAISPVALDLIDILDPILRDATLEGQARGIRICYAGPEQLELTCDPELLHRAFENVLRNALRYSPPGAAVEVSVAATGTAVKVTVSDSGPGVDAARLATIFQAFVRDETGTGTGLGLAIAANALRLHGGGIRAANRQGGGLEVTCTIPLAGPLAG